MDNPFHRVMLRSSGGSPASGLAGDRQLPANWDEIIRLYGVDPARIRWLSTAWTGSAFTPDAPHRRLGPGCAVILFAVRFERKGLTYLLQAFSV
jgi:hypothetical protein